MMDSPIFAYQAAIESGQENVGRWVRLFYAYVCRELLEGRCRYNAKKANRAIRFIETGEVPPEEPEQPRESGMSQDDMDFENLGN